VHSSLNVRVFLSFNGTQYFFYYNRRIPKLFKHRLIKVLFTPSGSGSVKNPSDPHIHTEQQRQRCP
ncbi:MAG: hypothetical protein MJE68_04750, partial [Proteobacteria bacterium]|nr:hypothetical protein [Pseudomonadota bacterium]